MSPGSSISDAHRDAFYRAAALGIAWLDARDAAPRRFGPAADASWRNYAGTPTILTELDRLELLMRDAASLHPDAFGARAVFDLPGLTDDEPFGQWDSAPTAGLARDTFRTPPVITGDLRALLTEVARVWSLHPGAVAPLPSLGPTTRLLVVGAAALVAVAARFADDRALSFHEQVIVLTDAPGLRQLAGIAALALGDLRAPRCVTPAEATASLVAGCVLVASDDAATDARVAAEHLLSRA